MNSVAFFRPSLLWVLLALALPVILHLLNRRRTIRLDFSTLRFFTATAVHANRARTIRRWLQLLARLGIVAGLVLIFAGPHDPADPFAVLSDPACITYVWIDRTVSMSFTEDSRSCAERTQVIVDSLREILPPSAEVLVYDEPSRDFVPYTAGYGMFLRYGPAGVGEMAAALRSCRERRAGPAVVIAVSDLQEPSAAGLDTLLAGDTLVCPVLCVSVRPRMVRNSGILDAGVAEENPSLVRVRIVVDDRANAPVHVSAVVAGMRAGRAAVKSAALDTVETFVSVPAVAEGAWGVAILESRDGFTADDTCVFLREQRRGRDVLVVGDGKSAYPIAAALGAIGSGYWGRVQVKRPAEVKSDDIERASLVVLDQVEYPTAGVIAALTRLGGRRSALVYSPALTPAALSLTTMVLARADSRATVRVDSLAGGASPVLTDTISPLWAGFPSVVDRTVAVYRFLSGLPGTPLLSLENGVVLATRLVDSSGGVLLLLSTPLGVTHANNLCESGFYVPLLDRLCRHAVGMISPDTRVWYAGHSYRNPYFGAKQGAGVFDGAGAMIGRWDHQPGVLFERPGAYRIVPDREPAYWVRVGMDPEERRLVYREPTPPPGRVSRVAVINERELPSFVRQAGRSRPAQFLWVVVGLCVLLEVLTWEHRTWRMSEKTLRHGKIHRHLV